MAFVKVMVHAVWGTKNHYPFITNEARQIVVSHIKKNATDKKIHIDRINGYNEHLHCLFGLNADLSIAKTLQLLKGESAFWINKQHLFNTKFEWADEYYAVSISESILDKVRKYIDEQEEHHRKVSFANEVDEFFRKYNFTYHG